jgi:predicted anti-sigma-YlaC factor YlaD
MSENLHARAEKLIAQDHVEGISQPERDWLSAHLQECSTCSHVAQQTSSALRSLRSAPIPLPRGLVARTQFRVQLRAQEMREREPKRRLLWTMCAVSWALGIGTAPYVWQAVEWIGQRTGAPRLLLEFGFGLWWAIPALFAAAIVVLENLRQANERDLSGR